MIGDVQCWLLKPLPWGHLDCGRYKNQKVKVRCIISKRILYLVVRMPKNNVIGGRLILEHFPEQLNVSGKNKPSIFCMWEKRRKQLAFLWRCSCAGWWKAKLERLGLRDRLAARPPAARLWWWRGPYGPRGPRMDILLNLLDHHPPFSIHSTPDQRWECALCARTFNPVMEFLGSRPIRHTTRTCVCSFAPASTHRQINDFQC